MGFRNRRRLVRSYAQKRAFFAESDGRAAIASLPERPPLEYKRVWLMTSSLRRVLIKHAVRYFSARGVVLFLSQRTRPYKDAVLLMKKVAFCHEKVMGIQRSVSTK